MLYDNRLKNGFYGKTIELFWSLLLLTVRYLKLIRYTTSKTIFFFDKNVQYYIVHFIYKQKIPTSEQN